MKPLALSLSKGILSLSKGILSLSKDFFGSPLDIHPSMG